MSMRLCWGTDHRPFTARPVADDEVRDLVDADRRCDADRSLVWILPEAVES